MSVQPNLTPGASRVWQAAAELALQAEAGRIEPAHLLWAIALDESRGAEILAEFGLTPQALARRLPNVPGRPVGSAAEPAGVSSEDRPPLPRSEVLEVVAIESRRLVGRGGEVGTEHILYCLAMIESPVRQLLIDHGLTGEAEGMRSAAGVLDDGPIRADIHLATAHPPIGDQTDLYRILDAAINRAREGLRVLEDYARFSADDRHLTEVIKVERHRLADALRFIEGRSLLAARDTERDVGTTVHTRREQTRESPLDVVRASCKRVQEAARTLEEYGKVVSPEFAAAAGHLRYASYTIEKALLTTVEARTTFEGRVLYLLATQAACPGGAGPVIRAALAAGVGIVQVREKSLPDRELVEWGRYVRQWTAEAGALFIMNDRPDLAVLTAADGVHVGQDELSVRDARRIIGPGKLVGVSTHTIEQARSAVLDGADYIGVGPVFASATKAFPELAGIEFVRQVASEITLPAFAIGGIEAKNVDQVLAAGAGRIAVGNAICGAADPAEATRELMAALMAG